MLQSLSRFFGKCGPRRRRRADDSAVQAPPEPAQLAAALRRAHPGFRHLTHFTMGAGASTETAHILIASDGRHSDIIIVDGAFGSSMLTIDRGALVSPGSRGGLELAMLASLAISDARLAAALAVAREESAAEMSDGPPPASAAALRRLPVVKMRAEDVVRDGNEHCCVCLEAQKCGDVALRLPCGHLYHKACALTWLQKHCTCPNCRYELQTDDPSYEAGRVARMRDRRPRYRLRELLAKPASDLCELLADAGVGTAAWRGRAQGDLVKCVIDSGAVHLIQEPAQIRIDCDAKTLRNEWTTKSLQDLMHRAGVDSGGCVEKNDLVDAIVASGRVRLLPQGADAVAPAPAAPAPAAPASADSEEDSTDTDSTTDADVSEADASAP